MERANAKVFSVNGHISASKQRPRVDYIYIRDVVLENYMFSEDGRAITLVASNIDLSTSTGTVSFVGRRQRAFHGVATTSHLLDEMKKDTKAGLTVYKDDYRHAEIFYDYSKSAFCFNALNRAKGLSSSAKCHLEPTGTVEFKIRATNVSYELYFREREQTLLSILWRPETQWT